MNFAKQDQHRFTRFWSFTANLWRKRKNFHRDLIISSWQVSSCVLYRFRYYTHHEKWFCLCLLQVLQFFKSKFIRGTYVQIFKFRDNHGQKFLRFFSPFHPLFQCWSHRANKALRYHHFNIENRGKGGKYYEFFEILKNLIIFVHDCLNF